MKSLFAAVATIGFAISTLPAMADHRGSHDKTRLAQACGYYIILGCSRDWRGANRTLSNLGGPGVGGPAGAYVVDTNQYPNFRNGWYCVADGPYRSAGEARSIAWNEAVRDAYVKSAC